MERDNLLARILVVEDNLYHLVVAQDKSVGVGTVDNRVCGIGASRKCSVQGRHFGGDVCDVVEEGAGSHVLAVCAV